MTNPTNTTTLPSVSLTMARTGASARANELACARCRSAPMPSAAAVLVAQRKAFDAALLRLRRLLGDDSLVRLEGG